MPVYNEVGTVRQAVDEVLAADIGTDIELVIVDDGSTDGTLEILDSTHWPPHVRVLKHDHNQGKGAAVRTALEAADAVIAVSSGTRDDLLRLFDIEPDRIRVIHNGIDADFFAPDHATDALARYGIDASVPYVLFVGRITRQKGIVHLVHALRRLEPGIGVVLAAGQPDTPELAAEVEAGVAAAQRDRANVVWIPEMLSRTEIRQVYSHAALFACPSVYEPFGIINLEAMACARAVVATAVGGIPEVVVNGETGLLVPVELRADEPMTPVDPDRFAGDLAAAINALMADPGRREAMGAAGRRRAVEQFAWSSIAEQTLALYRGLVAR